jgi:hypothetical protein
MAFTNYTIVPVDGVVVLDGVAYMPVDMTGIPDTVHAIVWDGVNETGLIQYKQLADGTLPAPGSFTDPADYYSQTEACVEPLVCYATTNTSEYKGQTYTIGQKLTIYQYPNPAVPLGFTTSVPPEQTLDYTYLFWYKSAFIWLVFDPNETLANGRSTCVDWVDQEGYFILQPTDWYVVRQSENGTPIPPNWNTWRQLIRQEARDKNAGVAACASIDELISYTTTSAFNTWTPSPS